ncbi:MAG: hypothetical protein KZQ64_09630 [gamma proteobacterium symbiont of Bathyaustriella thionipta]|nr:hypothetical protein [gamma proteobacterium symbiont of Bathyaustriella thionipta]MCU7950458.1 hypothetical protein [gamma proteobacterium symbiont of Bathyaustriella thionipta]MCU7953634.1 hypothetical protein [gamma proteobacterium symbiont of Bathyaustriella thionipta]MCU7956972.1 hypothetical protein [gamma proteobacterium symbiont of Bathyaustriella thionipta]MCU7966957.1 hypothetical protein [gamma proteobacterium symbiont of Bathyaustriella thionipta]
MLIPVSRLLTRPLPESQAIVNQKSLVNLRVSVVLAVMTRHTFRRSGVLSQNLGHGVVKSGTVEKMVKLTQNG